VYLFDSFFLIGLYEKHRSSLISSIARLTGCRETAAELAQEAYIRLLVHDNAASISHPEAYLFRIGRNLAIDHQRNPFSKNEPLPLDEELLCPLCSSRTSWPVFASSAKFCSTAIFSMPEPCRDVFLLRKLDELSYHDIAARLGISEKTVQRRLVQSMLHMNRYLSFIVSVISFCFSIHEPLDVF
jgi:RNA polymerase sigma factor (sigma-70 family)